MPATRLARIGAAAAASCCGLALSGLLGACTTAPAAAPRAAACVGQPDCPLEIRFESVGSEQVAVVEGHLSPQRPSMSYAFAAPARSRLSWSLRGPAVHTTLAAPDGDVTGPGVPEALPLRAVGRYVFSLSSNTMAEGIYGPFRLELRLSRAD